jgi:hypothetical protein
MRLTGFTLAVAVITSPAIAQTVNLSESPRTGDCYRLTTETNLTSALKVTRDGKPASIRVVATNQHVFLERVLAIDKNLIRKAARHYTAASSRATIDGEKVDRILPIDRRFVVAQRTGDSLFCFAPAGPMTRAELEVVSEHFETLHLTGVLPGKEVRAGETWKLDNGVAQSLCLFDGLIAHDLTGKLISADAGAAVISIEGTAKGIENGAQANLTVAATVRFDATRRRIVGVEWKQKDVRDQGPASPAGEFETTTTLRREFLDRTPDELTATVLTQAPDGDEPPATMQQIIHRDLQGRFQFLHARDWRVVGQTDHHLILRLLDRGDFVAQATLTCWKNAGPGKHMSAEEFEKLTSAGTGWRLEQVLDRSEIPTDSDRWIFRIAARGELDGVKVVQNFYVVAGARGDQMIVTFTMKANAADRIGTRDLAIVNAIDFPKK